MYGIWIGVAIVFVIVVLAVFIISMIDMNRFVVREYNVASTKIKKPVKAVFLTDLHNKKYGKNNEKLLECIRELKPDMVLCGGDMIVAVPRKKNECALDFIVKLATEYPVYYALGNHEYRAGIYPEKYGDMYREFEEPVIKCGVTLLRNKSLYLEACNIMISGLEIDRRFYKRFRKPFMKEDYVSSEIGASSKDAFQVLLAHNPDFFPEYAAYGADLTLSGHVHGGIVRLPLIGGCASPAIRLFPKYSGGLYQLADKKLIVSCGLGSHTIPMRVLNPGEVSVIMFSPEKEACV